MRYEKKFAQARAALIANLQDELAWRTWAWREVVSLARKRGVIFPSIAPIRNKGGAVLFAAGKRAPSIYFDNNQMPWEVFVCVPPTATVFLSDYGGTAVEEKDLPIKIMLLEPKRIDPQWWIKEEIPRLSSVYRRRRASSFVVV